MNFSACTLRQESIIVGLLYLFFVDLYISFLRKLLDPGLLDTRAMDPRVMEEGRID